MSGDTVQRIFRGAIKTPIVSGPEVAAERRKKLAERFLEKASRHFKNNEPLKAATASAFAAYISTGIKNDEIREAALALIQKISDSGVELPDDLISRYAPDPDRAKIPAKPPRVRPDPNEIHF